MERDKKEKERKSGGGGGAIEMAEGQELSDDPSLKLLIVKSFRNTTEILKCLLSIYFGWGGEILFVYSTIFYSFVKHEPCMFPGLELVA